MESISRRSTIYPILVPAGLALFGLSLALSKSASNVLISLLYLAALYQSVRYPDRRRILAAHIRQPLMLPLALYIGVAVVGIFYSEKLSDGFGIVNKMLGMALVYLMTAVLLDTVEEERSSSTAEGLLLAFITGVIVLDIIGLLTYLGVVGDKKYVLPIWPLHVHHIWFANINAVAFYAASLLLLLSDARTDARKKYLLLTFFPLSMLSLLLSFSRTAWFGVVVTLIVLSYFLVKNSKYYYLLLTALLAAGLVAYASNRIVHERINLIFSETALFFSGQAETNVGERFLMWKAAFKMFLSNPLFGVGTGDYVITMKRYMSSGEFPPYLSYFNQPHSMYFFALATNGLIGLGMLLYLFYRIISYSLSLIHMPGQERIFGFLGLAVAVHYLTGGMTDSFLNIQMLRYTFAFIVGICIRSVLKGRSVPMMTRKSL